MMPHQGLILRVDLSTGRISCEPVGEELRRKYLGGDGINSRLLWEHFLQVKPGIDPLGTDNVLIAGSGPLNGTPFGAGSKMQFTYKSPAYGIFGGTSSGGFFASQLRWAGYDHVVITGKAKHPVYLWIEDDNVEIKDAGHLRGMTADEANEAIRESLGDNEIETACIGQAGEHLVRFASIMVSCHRAAGRGGGGCVMGSKNLKAIAARGTKGICIHDPHGLLRLLDEYLPLTRGRADRQERMRFGTSEAFRRNQPLGFNTYRNGQGYLLPAEKLDRLDHDWYVNNMGLRATSCSAGCLFGCNHWHRIKGNESPAAAEYAGEWGTRPEYGAANPFGASCDVPDTPAVAHLTKMCNQYGMDTFEMGMGLSFLMELWERGIINEDDTSSLVGQPLSLEWGNYRALQELITATAMKQNKLGEILAEGVYRAALELGGLKDTNILKYASYGKGGATHEGAARGFPAMGLACAVASVGAHHGRGAGLRPGPSMKYFGKAKAGDPLSTALLGPAQVVAEILYAINNSVSICNFLTRQGEISIELLARALQVVTGMTLTEDELLIAGERVANLQKAFNSRLGLRRQHDSLCERWMNEPQVEGAAKGMKASNYLEAALDEYYRRHGWDERTALQTRNKMAELDMLDVAQVLEKEGALA
ncbi:MAG: hypothetical protein HY675_12320 [Chloroflexi bacterium]|nr:hypothetical protein [Chloroflexota bacterium]